MTTQIIFIGDSITAGNPPGLSAGQTWPGVAVAALQAAGKSVVYVNSGVSGSQVAGWMSTSVGALNTIWFPEFECTESVLYKTRVATVLLGINDLNPGSATAAATQARLAAMYATLKREGYSVLAITILPSTRLSGASETARQTINMWIKSSSGVPSFDSNSVTVLQDPTNATYYVDGTHPTVAGAAALGAAITTPLLAMVP